VTPRGGEQGQAPEVGRAPNAALVVYGSNTPEGVEGPPAEELRQQTERGNVIGGGWSGTEPGSRPEGQSDGSVSGVNLGDRNLDCACFEAHEEAQRLLGQDPSDPHYPDGDGEACEDLP
jgi:hypothetical protein